MKRAKACQHKRRTKHGRIIIVNKGIHKRINVRKMKHKRFVQFDPNKNQSNDVRDIIAGKPVSIIERQGNDFSHMFDDTYPTETEFARGITWEQKKKMMGK